MALVVIVIGFISLILFNQYTSDISWRYYQWGQYSTTGVSISQQLKVTLDKFLFENKPKLKKDYAKKISLLTKQLDSFFNQIVDGNPQKQIPKIENESVTNKLKEHQLVWSEKIKPMVELLIDISTQGPLTEDDRKEFSPVFDFVQAFSLNIQKSNEENQSFLKSEMRFYNRLQLIVEGIVFSLVVLLFFLGTEISRRLESLSKTASQIANGDLKIRFHIKKQDEIDTVSKSINKMVNNLLKEQKNRQQAEVAMQTKSRFLATMSHEIRTPMNAVLSSAHLLLDEIKNPAQVKLLKTILTSGDSLLILINDILDFSKLESGKMDIEHEPFHLVGAVQEAIDLLNSQASEKGITLNYQIDPRTPEWIFGDSIRYKQVLINLISNAIKFTHDYVEVQISGESLGSQQFEIFTSIKDNGIGIPKVAQSQLFQDFKQVDASTARKYGGTGLGLAICKGIVEAMKGQIQVKSEPDKGAEFYFHFTTESAPAGEIKKKTTLSKIHPHMAQEHPLRILLAEDNSVNQMVAQKMLAKLGYSIDIAQNGREVLEKLKTQSYDVILMDQHMPELDGLQTTEIIRREQKFQPQIMALTASAFKEDKDKCLKAGMNGFLSKPIDIAEVVAALKKVPANWATDNNITNPTTVIDSVAMMEQFTGAEEILGEIASESLKTLPTYMNQIQSALEQSDFEQLTVAAHTLKGVVANFQATELIEVAFSLEQMGRNQNIENAQKVWKKLEQLMFIFTTELKSLSSKKSA